MYKVQLVLNDVSLQFLLPLFLSMLDPKVLVVGAGSMCAFAFTYFLWRILLHSGSTHPPLPPGPRRLPFIGNALQAPTSKEWETYAKWGEEYGDIMSISILGQNIIILNSADIALEMLDAKGAIYSDRQMTPMIQLTGWSDAPVFMNTGKNLRQQRTYMHKLLGTPAALSRFHSLIEAENHVFLQRLLDSPENLADHIRVRTGSVLLNIIYGYTAKGQEDLLISHAEKTIEEFSLAGVPTSWIVNFLPILAKLPDWLPGAGFKRIAREWARDVRLLLDTPYEFVKEQLAAGTATPSLTSALIENKDVTSEEAEQIKWTSVALYGGGTDTTISAIRGFFLAMALYPDVFKKAQEEIDLVVGSQRLPSFSDRPNLPYMDAVIREVLRWNVVAPNAIPHKSSEDDIHAGYFIPGGSIVIPNVYSMLNDPRTYKEPERFNPERFLGENPEKDPRQIAFGFGRRICPGRILADDSLFITCTCSIATFDIKKKVRDSAAIEPFRRMLPGFISHPGPYEIDIKARSDQAIWLIRAR